MAEDRVEVKRGVGVRTGFGQGRGHLCISQEARQQTHRSAARRATLCAGRDERVRLPQRGPDLQPIGEASRCDQQRDNTRGVLHCFVRVRRRCLVARELAG